MLSSVLAGGLESSPASAAMPEISSLSLRNTSYRLVGLMVKASASRAEDPGFESRLHRDFSGVESYQ